jgi:hypothetical protein
MAKLRLIGYWRSPSIDVLSKASTWPGTFRLGSPPSDADIHAAMERYRAAQARWPDPRHFVDPSWDAEARARVADHLVRGALLVRYRGLSRCRFCGGPNGSAELTDGAYFWPEGFAHYVIEHDIRPPREFVDHALASSVLFEASAAPEFDHLGQRLSGWSGGAADSIVSLGIHVNVGRPTDVDSTQSSWSWDDDPDAVAFDDPWWVEIDNEWWLRHSRP